MISIIFGTFNRLPRLTQAIESIEVASQNFKIKPECIIIDGGSTDGSIEFLQNSDLDIKIIQEGGLHGVTKAYNRGFRLASHKYIAWTSDDCLFLPDALEIAIERLEQEDSKTLLSFSMDSQDGLGFVNYGENTPIGACSKTLFKLVDFWSEEFITYASDNDFSVKVHRIGGRVLAEPRVKIIHQLDLKDDLHNTNIPINKDSLRYREIYKKGLENLKEPKLIYPNIWIKANSIEELIAKIHETRLNHSWGNIYSDNDFGYHNLLASMNLRIDYFKGQNYYELVL